MKVRAVVALLALVLAGGAVAAVTADTTPPVITWSFSGDEGNDGWFRSDIGVTWYVSDPESIYSAGSECISPPAITASGQTRSCSATSAGGSSSVSTPAGAAKIDKDPPTGVTGAPSRGADSNGWYTSPVTVSFSGSDGVSGIKSCSSATYSGPESSSGSVSGSCTDNAGNVGSGSYGGLKYDATAPSVNASPARAPDRDGWYTSPVSFTASGTDGASGVESCSAGTYGGPDSGSASISATCRDNAGNSASRSFSLRYDSTRPEATGAALDRAPDHGEWYTKPVTVTFTGNDATSGIASCTSVNYSGPDGDANVTGTCTDRAGQTSAPRAFGFKYDDTAPELANAEARKGDRFVTLSWAATGGVAVVTVTRADLAAAATPPPPMYTGTGTSYTDRSVKNGVKYSYVLRVEDAAGNAVAKTIVATPRPKLYQPVRDARLRRAAPATFAWEAVPKATYYNFQLHRRVGGRWVKVLTRWPGKPWFALPRRWQGAHGATTTLKAGRYRWYVWPATGLRSQRRYGKLEGSSEFSVG